MSFPIDLAKWLNGVALGLAGGALKSDLSRQGRSMVGGGSGQLGSSQNVQFSGATSSATYMCSFVAPYDLVGIAPIFPNYQRDTARSVFWGEMPLYVPFKFKAELVRIRASDGAIDVTPLTFGGQSWVVATSRKPIIQADMLPVYIPAGERYYIRTVPFTMLNGVTPSTAVISGSTSGGALHAGTYTVGYTYVYGDETETVVGPTAQATITGSTGSITVTPPSDPGHGAVGYRIYCSPPSPASDAAILYETFNGVQPFSGGTSPVITAQLSTTSYGRLCVSTSVTSQQVPVCVAIAGAPYTTAGGCNTGEWASTATDTSGPNINQNGSNNTSGGYGPMGIEGIAADGAIHASVVMIGDSRMNDVGDVAFWEGGGFAMRALANQTSQYAYDNTKLPLCGYHSLASSGEQAAQFATPYFSFKRRAIARKYTHFWTNYSINDLKITIGNGSATLINNLITICAGLCSGALTSHGIRMTGMISTIPPYTNTSDGFMVVANQYAQYDSSTFIAYTEGYRRQFNNWARYTGGAQTIAGETPFAAKKAANATHVTPSTNLYAGGDGSTTTFVTQYPFVVGSEAVTVSGIAKAVTTDYTYTDQVTIGGTTYASGITFVSAPANAAPVLISYTSMAGMIPFVAANTNAAAVFLHDGSAALEVNASGVLATNGGWWKPNGTVALTTTAVTGGSSSTAVFPASTFTVDQYRGYNIVNVSSCTGTITSNNTNVSDGDTVTINSTVYRFKTTMAQAFDVQIGASASASLTNLQQAINGTGTPGTNYFAGTTTNPDVKAGAISGTPAMTLSALYSGAAWYNVSLSKSAATLTLSGLSVGATGVLAGTKFAVISKNDTTTLTVSGGFPAWAAPAAGDTILILDGYTYDGTHQSTRGHVMDAQQFNPAFLALPKS